MICAASWEAVLIGGIPIHLGASRAYAHDASLTNQRQSRRSTDRAAVPALTDRPFYMNCAWL